MKNLLTYKLINHHIQIIPHVLFINLILILIHIHIHIHSYHPQV